MAVRRHAVRKLKLPQERSLDERLGPVQLGVWALSLYALGLMWWAWQDGTPQGWQRWTFGATVAVGVAGLVSLALCAVSPRWLHRGLAIALCVSLAIHLSMVVGLSRVRLVVPRATRPAEPPPVPPPVPQASLPAENFVPLAVEGEQRDEPLERQPVPTGEIELPIRDVPQPTHLAQTDLLSSKIEGAPDVPRNPPLSVLQRQEYTESVPRQGAAEGRLSRQELDADLSAGQAGQVPLQIPRDAVPPTPNLATIAPLPRRSASLPRRSPPPIDGDDGRLPEVAIPAAPRPSDLPAELATTDPRFARSTAEIDLPLVASESSAARMMAPTRDAVPDAGTRRRLMLGGPVTDAVRVERAGAGSMEADELPEPVAAKPRPAAPDPRRGQTPLPDVALRLAGLPLEVGSPRPHPAKPIKQPTGGEAPQVAPSMAERMTTARTLGGSRRPALPTDVQALDVALPTEALVPPAPSIAAVATRTDRREGDATNSTGIRPAMDDLESNEASFDPRLSPAADLDGRVPGAVTTDPPSVGKLVEPVPAAPRARTIPFAADLSVDEPSVPAPPPTSSVDDQIEPALTSTTAPRRSAGALPVVVDGPTGVGGLAQDVAPDVGLLTRQAQPEVDQVVDTVGRFIRQSVGGPLSIDRDVPLPTPAYRSRIDRRGERPVSGNGQTSVRTEQAIEAGLLYLAEYQRADGSWTLNEAGEPDEENSRAALTIQSDTAASGLSLLAFLGAGYHHRSDKHGTIVREGLKYLIAQQQPNGDLYLPSDVNSNRSAWMYSHAIAAIALCEAYGMTQDPELRGPAQRAVDFIVQAQHPERGGWRYAPGVGSDTSVSGWMVMALRSAELANLTVPVDVWQRVEVWLDLAKASADRTELYRYNPLAPNTKSQGHGRRPTKTMTAVGLLMRLYTGWRRDDAQMIAGADYLLNNLPDYGDLRDPQRDTYYWYYATQVMFHMRGDYWERWNNQLHELLTSTQQQQGALAGSWDPWTPLPDRWAPHAGRLYVTTMNLLSLEVVYRHLPIYEDTAR